MYYAGIGMRDKYPLDLNERVNATIIDATSTLARLGYTQRSGHAPNTDMKFESGALAANGKLESYLPKKGFNNAPSFDPRYINLDSMPNTIKNEARSLTEKFHPNTQKLDNFSFSAMDRNAFQVLGRDLRTPSKFILFVAKKSFFDNSGRIMDCSGGTGQAVRIAYYYKIPAFNLLYEPHLQRLEDFIKNYKEIPHRA
jgi:hypothetical protein